MHHRDAGADECQQYARGSSRSRRAPLLHQITIMSCSTRFHWALTRSTALVWVLMEVLKRWFIAWCCTLLFVSGWRGGCLLYFCFSFFCIEAAKFMAARGSVSNHNLLYNKPKAIPLLMTDVLNGVSGPRMNKRAHSNLRGSSGLEWDNICLLHQGLVHPLPGSLMFYKLRGINFKEPARCLVFRLSFCNFNCHSF